MHEKETIKDKKDKEHDFAAKQLLDHEWKFEHIFEL
jgi:hypothetical protein